MLKSQHRGQRYCSVDCRKEHTRRRLLRVCENCGNEFTPSGGGQQAMSRRFCSRQCQHAVSHNNTYVDGRSRHPHYDRWYQMVSRCTKPHHKMWNHYGGRGISVCDEWMDPLVFYAYLDDVLGPCPEGHSIDRIDNDGDYEPGNVRWASDSEQWRNQRHTREYRPLTEEHRRRISEGAKEYHRKRKERR